jgi:hypothetical protein
VLKPGALLVLGDNPRRAIERLPTYETNPDGDARPSVGTLTGSDWSADVYPLAHPRVGHAAESDLLQRLGA